MNIKTKGTGPILSVEALKPLNKWYIEACETPGLEFVEAGVISQATQEILENQLVSQIKDRITVYNGSLSKVVAFH